MKLIKLTILLHFLTIILYAQDKNKYAFSFLNKQDSLLIDVYYNEDYFFYSEINSPVCEDGVCNFLKIKAKWNLAGSYVQVDTVPNYPLTKYDHEPFTKSDYEQLHNMLLNKQSVFARAKKSDLLEQRHIDGYTGATSKEISVESVKGAVYTCFVLYNLINGDVIDRIGEYIGMNLNDDIIDHLMDLNEHAAYDLLVKSLAVKDYMKYQDEITQIIITDKGNLAKKIIDKMPFKIIKTKRFQDDIASSFSTFAYYTRKSLLHKLRGNLSSESLVKAMSNAKDDNYKIEAEKNFIIDQSF